MKVNFVKTVCSMGKMVLFEILTGHSICGRSTFWKMVRFWLNLAYYIIKHANYARSTNQNEFCTADLYLWWLRAPFFELTFWFNPLFAKILYALSEKKLLAKWNVFKKLRVVKFIACGLLECNLKSSEAWFKDKSCRKLCARIDKFQK